MKKLLLILLIGVSLCCFSQNNNHKITFGKYTVLQENKKGSFKILDQKENIVYDNLKYVNYTKRASFLQVLDKTNTVFYLDQNLNKTQQPQTNQLAVCGTIASYGLKVIEKEKVFLIEFTENRSIYGEGIKKSIIDTVSKKTVKDIYFVNSKRELNFDENTMFPKYIIIDYGDKFGIKNKNSVSFYDAVDLKNPFTIKVKKKNRYGYYSITSGTKYTLLEGFEFNLAKFEKPCGKTGYIDLNGKEY